MDLLEILRQKISVFSRPEDAGIRNVLGHIEIAETHYENGRKGTDYLFNDVIYRSNQAFEGALKEAYRIFKGIDDPKVKPYEVEQFFIDSGVLEDRVSDLFKNYRQNWRNTSTHDYKIYFKDQEAFLALISIIAFTNILLDQMIVRKVAEDEKTDLLNTALHQDRKISKADLLAYATEIILEFSKDFDSLHFRNESGRILSTQLIGALSGYIQGWDQELRVGNEVLLLDEQNMPVSRADLILQNNSEMVLIEVKNFSKEFLRRRREGEEQIRSYLVASKIKKGILYFTPRTSDAEMLTDKLDFSSNDEAYSIVVIYPHSEVRTKN